MTILVIHPETAPSLTTLRTTEADQIGAELADRGVRFEQWTASVRLGAEAGAEEVLTAYSADVDRLRAEGYTTVDVVRMVANHEDPDWPATVVAARSKFLSEHTHDDDEVRFFVEGSGAFYLRINGEVLIVVCEAGDLLSVPANTTHWFDMGTDPQFAAIRFFRIPEGWVGNFTGDDIATRFECFDELVAV
jgi:1,2-dihydroxy-3-keto-5-methylthiopentene dioxygenase